MGCLRLAALLGALTGIPTARAQQSLVDLVDTRIGSGGAGFGIGSLPPGAQVPYGALRMGPDSTWVGPIVGQVWVRFNHFSGYYYNDTHIRAFSHTHMVGAGVADLGNFGVMPVRALAAATITNSATASPYMSSFSHETETASPGYYAVSLPDHAAEAELTAMGAMSGVHRYTYLPPANASAASDVFLLVDVCHTTAPPGGACTNANVSVSVLPPSSNGSAVVVVQAGLSMNGDMTGRQAGGLPIFFYAEATAVAAPAGGGAPVPLPGVPSTGVWAANQLYPSGGPQSASSGTSGNLGAWLGWGSFPSGAASVQVTLRVGLSFIDAAHAKGNLYAQQGAALPSFDAAKAAAQATWEAALGRVAIALPDDTPAPGYTPTRLGPAGAPDALLSFYSSLYHTYLAPTTYSEWDGAFVGLDGELHTLAPGQARRLSDLSLWDIFRSAGPWYALGAPDVARDIATSLGQMLGELGRLPRWPLANIETGCMDGSHGVVLLADYVLRGVPGVNASAAYAVAQAALSSQDAQGNYSGLGFVSIEASNTAASTTLEYAIDDGAGAGIAGFLGQAAQQAVWAERAQSYRNSFSGVRSAEGPQLCPRYANGTFACPLLPIIPYPLSTSGYTEGDAQQYMWLVTQDPAGLVSLFANGSSEYAAGLYATCANAAPWPFALPDTHNDVLPNAWAWMGNEPSVNIPYMFAWAGNAYAWMGQLWSRTFAAQYFTPSSQGVPGNSDYGEMDGWNLFALLGLFAVPGSDSYVLVAPTVANATIYGLDGAPILTIIAHNASAQNGYVSAASVNGVPLPSPFVSQAALTPSAFAPDCASISALGPRAEEASTTFAAHCSGSPRGKKASKRSRAQAAPAPGLLELWMSPHPAVFGSGEPIESAHPEQAPFLRHAEAVQATPKGQRWPLLDLGSAPGVTPHIRAVLSADRALRKLDLGAGEAQAAAAAHGGGSAGRLAFVAAALQDELLARKFAAADRGM